ncbi:hypothetical protein DFH07DRAFT_749550 [Mycena maculata]|uniref:Uncharacterized protein n=1 Tax=Mycena maculata TaxID=230809 RepID=A0AAD7IJ56_9AGAR|nr:hypothetical protein DFH07DRAFT_749550 [Mycena maculata]
MTQTFRRVCNVSGNAWPDPTRIRTNEITGEVYPTPFFHLLVSDTRNGNLCLAVATQALSELKDKEVWPDGLQRRRGEPDPTWNLAYFKVLAKKSFRTCRKQWRDRQNDETGGLTRTNVISNRHNKRRIRKSEQLLKVLQEYAERHGLDLGFLKVLIDEQFLSDEVSGPEDDSGESKDAWRVRMAAAAGLPTAPDALKKLHFLEVLVPDWRSKAYSDLIHDIEQFRFEGSSDAQKLNLKYNRVLVGRSSDRVPKYAPYNFGISREWFNTHSKVPEYETLLRDWDKYPEPVGCGLVLEP